MMVGRRSAGTGQMGAGRLAVVARGLMQRVFSRGTGNDERRAPWVWVRRRLTEGGLRCGSRGGRWSSESWSKGRGRCARRDGVGLGAVVVLGLGRPAGGRSGGDRGRTCASRTAMSSRRLRSAPSDLGENAVAEPEVRSRRRWVRLMSQKTTSGAVISWHQHSGRALAPQPATLKPGHRRETGDHLQGEHRQQPVGLGAHVPER